MKDIDVAMFGGDYDEVDLISEDEENEYLNVDLQNANEECELEKEEQYRKSTEEWTKIFFISAATPKVVSIEMLKTKPFERDPANGKIIPTASLKNLVYGFCSFLLRNSKIRRIYLRKLSQIFSSRDLFHYVSANLQKRSVNVGRESVNTWWNIFHFATFVPHASVRLTKLFFGGVSPFTQPAWSKRKKAIAQNDYDNLWLALMTGNVNSKVALKMIVHITEHVLPLLRTPFKSSDFFFKMFEKGDTYAILSLGAIFKLITCHNFEYPNFYDHVYSLTKPSLFHLESTEKVLNLLNAFLSSSHVPIYIVAAFAKRLSRCLLFSSIEPIEPTLGLIRNLLTRHPNAAELVNRPIPATLSMDPFDNDEDVLSKTNVMQSSLWEIKILQHHWSQNVRKRAGFVDKSLQKIESFVRYKSLDEIMANDMAKSFGEDSNQVSEGYLKSQAGEVDEDEDDHSEENAKFNKRKGGKFQKKHEEKKVHSVAFSFLQPPVDMLHFKTALLNGSSNWSL
ncbi:unnamed protein product [Caenorhabditis auriculariae]|uniref:CCAAT-binding factor domain-containing protein n=1 Tax=Caenorhabditis auriculariae TaxID=2777116 RepID=A0A8S1GYD1_9PELO|nr:unnamed protein product [Caenorhabditis auriculariae]